MSEVRQTIMKKYASEQTASIPHLSQTETGSASRALNAQTGMFKPVELPRGLDRRRALELHMNACCAD